MDLDLNIHILISVIVITYRVIIYKKSIKNQITLIMDIIIL